MPKNSKKSQNNLGKKGKKIYKRTLKKSKTCQSCNFIRFGRGSKNPTTNFIGGAQPPMKFGGCPDCGMVSGGGKGSCGCKSNKKKGGSPNMDKLPSGTYYPLNTYKNDVSWSPFVKSSTLLGGYSRVTGGKRKTHKRRNYKKGGGILSFFSLPSNDYVTTNNTLGGVYTQRDILAGNAHSNSDPRFQPVLDKPYGVTNPPLV
jgi:hypothetical protein